MMYVQSSQVYPGANHARFPGVAEYGNPGWMRAQPLRAWGQ